MDVGGGDVREGCSAGPDELREIDFDAGQDYRDEAGEDDGAGNAAGWISGFVGERGNAIEADVGEHGDGCAVEDRSGVEAGAVVNRIEKEASGGMGEVNNPTN